MAFKVICLFVICFVVTSIEFSAAQHYDPVFVSVLFRHADRTPTRLYKNDPNPWKKFNPPGLGQLTKAGGGRAYQLGLILRDRYRNFLGRNFKMPERVHARSTNSGRTKKSMELVLKALYQPGKRDPLNYFVAKKGTDTLLFPTDSKAYRHEFNQVRHYNHLKPIVNKFNSLMHNLSKWTGQTIKTTDDIAELYHTLTAESAMGLEIPNWAQDRNTARQIEEATILNYKIHNYNTELKKNFGGVLLKQIIETMEKKATNQIRNGRMQLFSAHETNVVALLSALGLYEPHVPGYSSTVIIELLKDSQQKYYTRILYYQYIPSRPKTLWVPGCSMEPCPLDEFQRLMQPVMP